MSDHSDDEPGLGLDEVLAALRHDLTAARDASDDDAYGLGVSQVEIELSVEIGRRRSAEGGLAVKWFVLSGDARARAERHRTDAHRIRLTLGPVPSGSGRRAAEVTAPSDRAPSGGEQIGPRIAEDQ